LGIGLSALKRSLLAFWATWLTLAMLTNVIDAFKAFGIGAQKSQIASGNYRALQSVKSRLSAPRWVGNLLFGGVVLWQGLGAGLFWRACLGYRPKSTSSAARVNQAFTGGLGLWAAFMVADELFAAYEPESAHMRAFTAQLVSLMSMYLLPD